jgi:hypothetical protein
LSHPIIAVLHPEIAIGRIKQLSNAFGTRGRILGFRIHVRFVNQDGAEALGASWCEQLVNQEIDPLLIRQEDDLFDLNDSVSDFVLSED